jgi:ParB family chromosome partitioning protein
MSEEAIATRHFVTPVIVKQRLRLASVSPNLLNVYADDGMTLEQLMAFTVNGDHARQEQVWENASKSGYDEPYQIRRMLTENTVRASDKRVQFVGIEAYAGAVRRNGLALPMWYLVGAVGNHVRIDLGARNRDRHVLTSAQRRCG